MITKHGDNWDAIFSDFQNVRKPDADAIAELAIENYYEMRDKVADPKFLLKKKIEAKFSEKHPDEADRAEILDATDGLSGWEVERHFETIPDVVGADSIFLKNNGIRNNGIEGQGIHIYSIHGNDTSICIADLDGAFGQRNSIAEICFTLVERVVAVEVFGIGQVGCRRILVVRGIGRRVSLLIVKSAVARQQTR